MTETDKIGVKVRCVLPIICKSFPDLNTRIGETGTIVDYDELGPVVVFGASKEVPVEWNEIEALQ